MELGRDGKNTVERTVTYAKTDVVSTQINIVVKVWYFRLSDYYQKDSVIRIDQINDPIILIRNVDQAHVRLYRTSLGMSGFNYSHGPLSVTFHFIVSAKNVPMLLINPVKAGHYVCK